MLSIDIRGQLEAAGHIVRNHTHAELTSILAELRTGDVADAIRAHMARRSYRARTAPAIPTRRVTRV